MRAFLARRARTLAEAAGTAAGVIAGELALHWYSNRASRAAIRRSRRVTPRDGHDG